MAAPTKVLVRTAPPTLFDPRKGDVPFELGRLTGEIPAQRVNSFTILLILEGTGRFRTDAGTTHFAAPVLLFFNPYQAFAIEAEGPLAGEHLRFHANFFCIETHHHAVGCNGVLFNDVYGSPMVPLDDSGVREFRGVFQQIEEELRAEGLAHTEVLVSFVKILLIKATRLKLGLREITHQSVPRRTQPVLERLVELIEENYRTHHTPAFYVETLNITGRTLARMVKATFNRTLTDLIRDRVLKHAKWQLLHTLRPVKEIAWEVGFEDELYFSRLFRKATGMAPTAYRDFETAIRGGANLSMSLTPQSLPPGG